MKRVIFVKKRKKERSLDLILYVYSAGSTQYLYYYCITIYFILETYIVKRESDRER